MWSGRRQRPAGLALFSFSSFFQNPNSAPGGPKSWAQLNGKPAGHEGGECACGVALGRGRDAYLSWTVPVQSRQSLAWSFVDSSPSEVLPLRGGADSADHVNSLVSLNIIAEDNPPGVRRRPQCWPCTPRLAELMEQVLAQQAPASSLMGRGVVCGCAGLRPRWLAAWVCKSAGLGAELLAFGRCHQSRQRLRGVCCHGVPPDTGRHTQILWRFSPGTVEGAWEEEVSRASGQCRVAR